MSSEASSHISFVLLAAINAVKKGKKAAHVEEAHEAMKAMKKSMAAKNCVRSLSCFAIVGPVSVFF